MDHLSETIDLPFFYGCMWRVMVSNPGLRPPALNYLLRRFPKITGAEGNFIGRLSYIWYSRVDW